MGSEMCIRDRDIPTILLTDASRLYGIGYCLVQQREDKSLSLVYCGSCSLTPTQQRYAAIKLECLAIQWAVQKCNHYLRGLPIFQIWTDHRPLEGIFQKSLHELDNQRLMRMREKILPYSFSVTWVPGKTHYIADALSRYPVFQPEADHIPTEDAVICLQATADTSLKCITCLLYTSDAADE